MGALSSTASAAGVHRFFLGPASTSISCEIASGVPGLGTFAYCVDPKSLVAATMKSNGEIKICRGMGCMSDPPENAVPLKSSTTIGPFRCKPGANSITCVVAKTGFGFSISPIGLATTG